MAETDAEAPGDPQRHRQVEHHPCLERRRVVGPYEESKRLDPRRRIAEPHRIAKIMVKDDALLDRRDGPQPGHRDVPGRRAGFRSLEDCRNGVGRGVGQKALLGIRLAD